MSDTTRSSKNILKGFDITGRAVVLFGISFAVQVLAAGVLNFIVSFCYVMAIAFSICCVTTRDRQWYYLAYNIAILWYAIAANATFIAFGGVPYWIVVCMFALIYRQVYALIKNDIPQVIEYERDRMAKRNAQEARIMSEKSKRVKYLLEHHNPLDN